MPVPRPTSVHGLVLLLAGAGATHFAAPKIYDAMIPAPLPGSPRMWTYGSGVCELGVAALIAVPTTRRAGALAAVGLFVGVLPANVKMALDARRGASTAMQVGTVLRLPLQAPLIVGAWRVFRQS